MTRHNQQYGVACAPELSYCGMQDGGRLCANETVVTASASASAATSLVTDEFMACLHIAQARPACRASQVGASAKWVEYPIRQHAGRMPPAMPADGEAGHRAKFYSMNWLV
jgi:hypothetical protein